MNGRGRAGNTAGIVLAAGASRRMGFPKALLPTPSGLPLAAWQAERLAAAGCRPVGVVVGAGAGDVRRALPGNLLIVENPRWAEGRATSLQAGMAAFPDATGWLFAPVDAVGIRLESLRALLAAAAWNPDVPWRPCHRGAKGNLLWLPRPMGAELAALPPAARIDEWIAGRPEILDCDDPSLLRNVNTRDVYEGLGEEDFNPEWKEDKQMLASLCKWDCENKGLKASMAAMTEDMDILGSDDAVSSKAVLDGHRPSCSFVGKNEE